MKQSMLPPKKRKYVGPSSESPRSSPLVEFEERPPSSQTLTVLSTQSLTRKEIAVKQRNMDEIRRVYKCLKHINVCLSQEDKSFASDIEKGYLTLIAASKGCRSVRRIVADLIPQYACYCPTALEAAAEVMINMHNWSLELINRGEDSNGIAFATARACIFGLADICCTASSVAPKSAVIRGISSAVFQNVLTFFMAFFEGKDVMQLVDKNFLNMQDSIKVFSELKQKVLDKDECLLTKLTRSCALCLLWIFFSCPKDLLAACLELSGCAAKEKASKGHHFLGFVTSTLDDGAVQLLDSANVGPKSCTGSTRSYIRYHEGDEEIKTDDNHVSECNSSLRSSCLLMQVLNKDSSLREWMLCGCKKLLDLLTDSSPEISSVLEGIIEMFAQQADLEDCQVDSDEDKPDSSIYMNRNCVVPRISEEHDIVDKSSGKVGNSSFLVNSSTDCLTDKVSDKHLIAQGSAVICSTPRDSVSHQISPSGVRIPVDFKSTSCEVSGDFTNVEKNQVFNMNLNSPPVRSSSETESKILILPNNSFMSPSASKSQIAWCSDGDPAAMDIVSASKQLWVGCVGPDMSESHIRFHLERFGPIEKYFFLSVKGFALVEYRNIIDAVKTRHCLPGSFPCCVKFMDIGFGTRGDMNGLAIGYSSYIYAGRISSQLAKDEILHEAWKVIRKRPLSVIDLSCECALLMEFETPEEAVSVMLHLRQFRRERSNYNPHSAPETGNAGIGQVYSDGAIHVPGPPHLELRINNQVAGPSHARTSPENPADSAHTRMSHLSSLLASLRTKYNINQNIGLHDNYIAGNSYAFSMCGEDIVPSSTLWITIPSSGSLFLTDDELMAICILAVGNSGSIVRLTQANMNMGCGWFVECNNVDAAVSVLKNLRACPGLFFQIQFSKPGNQNVLPFPITLEKKSMEHVSPRINSENHGGGVHGAPMSQSNWHFPGSREMTKVGARKADGYDNLSMVPQQGGNVTRSLSVTQGPSFPPPQQIQSSTGIRPIYGPPNGPWGSQGRNNHLPVNKFRAGVMPNNSHGGAALNPFVPASVTLFAQIQGTPMQPYNQLIPQPVIRPPLSSLPHPHPEILALPPLPKTRPPLIPPPPLSSPPHPHPEILALPPLPQTQPPLIPPPPLSSPPHPHPEILAPPPLPQTPPPLIPPPPSSPPPSPHPPLPVQESVNMECSSQSLQYQWHGTLCKSGVDYCTIYACRADSNICSYTNAIPEPAEWPTKLDMAKRTNFQHVKSAFTATPPDRVSCQISFGFPPLPSHLMLTVS
ncbi:hypothetical protein TanjilG_01100 [Lupinus angustifolius]|uniref:RRM domain-containing protein n=1 Tax=Lupinus angustifolius TaxID=3871 RepID=A0A1J7IKR2_LUPAN|nr:hypothetical protein TanjilG_01100 [Lupinus angustifolius]